MKRIKNVSKQEIKDSLNKSISLNNRALDYIQNCLNRSNDRLKYNENDVEYIEISECLQYIDFTLRYVGKQYQESLKRCK